MNLYSNDLQWPISKLDPFLYWAPVPLGNGLYPYLDVWAPWISSILSIPKSPAHISCLTVHYYCLLSYSRHGQVWSLWLFCLGEYQILWQVLLTTLSKISTETKAKISKIMFFLLCALLTYINSSLASQFIHSFTHFEYKNEPSGALITTSIFSPWEPCRFLLNTLLGFTMVFKWHANTFNPLLPDMTDSLWIH